jgi:chaperonin cofactor prefoldin
MLESASAEVKKEIDELEAEKAELKSGMDELKGKLYKKFGHSINLEEE